MNMQWLRLLVVGWFVFLPWYNLHGMTELGLSIKHFTLAWPGADCEDDFDACADEPCPLSTTCTDLNATEHAAQGANGTGYTCSDCPTGYTLNITDGVPNCFGQSVLHLLIVVVVAVLPFSMFSTITTEEEEEDKDDSFLLP